MYVIGIFGKKGGSGKTLVSHYLAHGMSLGLGKDTVLMQTDVRAGRPDNIVQSREYAITSIQNKTPKEDLWFIMKSYHHFMSFDAKAPVLIIDGGANRSALDLALTPFCDLVLIPTQYSDEDTTVAEQDYWALTARVEQDHKEAIADGKMPLKQTQVMMIQNRWPGNKQRMKALLEKPRIDRFLRTYTKMDALFPTFIPDMQSLTDVAHGNDPQHTPLINGQARAFAAGVATLLGIPYELQKLMPAGHFAQISAESEAA